MTGSVALTGQHKLIRSIEALSTGGQEAPRLTAPHNLFTATYPESFLKSKLVGVNQWHPCPRCSERGPWEAVPTDIRAAFVDQAIDAQRNGWSQLLATTFLQFKRNGNESTYMAASFGRRRHLAQVVLAECMENQGRFLDDIANGIWLICEESFWGISAHMFMQHAGVGLPDVTDPVVDLFAAETAQLLAWTRYLLAGQLDKVSPLISKRIVIESERRILGPARNRNDFYWMGLDGPGMGHRLDNWNPWINSNLLVTNLLLEEDPDHRLQEIVRITRTLDAYLNQYWPDAAEEEGPAYYNHSPLCLFECINTLESATGNSTSILSNPFIDAMGRYILNAHIAGQDFINYGDADMQESPDGNLVYRYGRAVHDDQMAAFGAWCAKTRGCTAKGSALTSGVRGSFMSLSRPLAAVLSASEIRSAPNEDALLRDVWYPDFGLMAARKKAGSTEGMYVAVLASNNGRGHGHNDTGNFIIFQDGEPVTIDVGVGTYNSKTFSTDRYTIWTMQSAYHSLPTIGGVMQQNGPEYRATNRRYSSDNQRATLSCNLATAYPRKAGIKRWIRTVTLDRVRDEVRIHEDFELESAVPVNLSIMTSRSASVGDGIITLKLTGGSSTPASLKFDSAQLEPVAEKISLSDPRLHQEWGDEIYRILLKSKHPVIKGDWSYEFSHA